MPAPLDSIAIVGVGLIGGSIALGARQRGLCQQVVGVSREPDEVPTEMVDKATLFIEEAAAQCELIFICTPPRHVERLARFAAQAARPGTIISDVASTKGRLVEAIGQGLANGCPFVGGHPLAGSHERGPQAADGDLFVGSRVILTPGDADRSAVEAVTRFWTGMGAEVIEMNALEHDQRLACSSHLPHIVASALASATPEEALSFTAGGWRDTTRIAAADPELWADILIDNQTAVYQELGQFEDRLRAFREALEAGDREALLDCFRSGKERRDALGS